MCFFFLCLGCDGVHGWMNGWVGGWWHEFGSPAYYDRKIGGIGNIFDQAVL